MAVFFLFLRNVLLPIEILKIKILEHSDPPSQHFSVHKAFSHFYFCRGKVMLCHLAEWHKCIGKHISYTSIGIQLVIFRHHSDVNHLTLVSKNWKKSMHGWSKSSLGKTRWLWTQTTLKVSIKLEWKPNWSSKKRNLYIKLNKPKWVSQLSVAIVYKLISSLEKFMKNCEVTF